MKEFKVEHIVEAIGLMETAAQRKKDDAAWGGRMDDGGAGILFEKLQIFETMWDGTPLPESRVPKFIEPTLIQVERKYDPEYEKYLELKSKFEGK
jgi:hypothetical protein